MTPNRRAFARIERSMIGGLGLTSGLAVVMAIAEAAEGSAAQRLTTAVVVVLLVCLNGIILRQRRRLRQDGEGRAARSREIATLAKIATLTSNAAVVTDLSGRIEWVNAGFERITGYGLAETRGRTPGSVLQCEASDPRTIAELSAARRERRPIRREILNRAKDGRLYWVDLDVQPLHDETGHAVGFVAVQADITEAKRLSAAMAEKSANLEMMARLAKIGLWTLDPAKNALAWSDDMRIIHESEAEPTPGFEAMLDCFPGARRGDMAEAIAAALGQRRPWEIETPFRTARGRRRWVRSVGVPIVEDGQVVKLVGALQDMTEAVAARQDIALANQRLQLAVDSAHIGLWDWNVAEDCFWTNPSWWTYLGFAEPQPPIADEFADRMLHPDDLPKVRANRAHFLREKPKQLVNEFRHRDGEGGWRWILSTGQVTRQDPDGTVIRVSGVYIDIHDRKLSAEQTAHAARHDMLTGLANRSLLIRSMEEASARLSAGGAAFSIFMLDLDRFKAVNDSFGHATGDLLLKTVAGRIQSEVRRGDVVARLGGDEFAILLEAGEPHGHGLGARAERLLEAVSAPTVIEGIQLQVGASIGIAMAPDHGSDTDALLRAADYALYAAKAEGRGGFCFFDRQLEAAALDRRALEADLRQALVRRELELRYRPIVALDDGRTVGAEAVPHWRHPVRGLLGPEILLPLAQQVGLIVAVGEWGIDEACREAAAWPEATSVAVDLSAAQIGGGSDAVGIVTRALLKSGLAPARLQLEVAETILQTEGEALLPQLRQLHALGVRLTLDEFGSGEAALGLLRQLPFATIKVAAVLVRGLGRDAPSEAIVCAVANLAHSLGLTMTATGVETTTQARLAAAAGCRLAQGAHFAQAPPPVASMLQHVTGH